MNFRDSLLLAFKTIRANRLRTGLTVAIIAFGIMALVGIKTAITAMQQKFMESFSSMGANGFTVRYREPRIRFGGDGPQLEKQEKGKKKVKNSNSGKPFTRPQAEAFKKNYHFPAKVSVNIFGARDAVVSFATKKNKSDRQDFWWR